MAVFNRFDTSLDALVAGELANMGSDILKFALTNTAPTGTTDQGFLPGTLHPPPAAANGYTAGGHVATIASWSRSGAVYTLACVTDVVITATAGGIGPFRYVLLYNDTHASDQLIGYWDYGSSLTLAAVETFTIDVTSSLLTITAT
jgi:hypothetical protein